jgi:adenine-specific DNA-methyltransferase
VWKRARHDAGWHGSVVLRKLLNARSFDFPKSLYAVRDALEPVVGTKPDALVLDFFAGSGTTAHAVALLNHADGGRRVSISVTNNEVGANDEKVLREADQRPGDPEWEQCGIFRSITVPRIVSAFTGVRPDGELVELDYDDGSSAADGLKENVEFFDLTYEDPERVRYGLGFEAIAPLLWFRAGSRGARISSVADTFAVADAYAVLFDVDAAAGFVAAVRSDPGLEVAYVVTDDETQFQVVAGQLPHGIDTVRLYAAYLDTFRIQAGA